MKYQWYQYLFTGHGNVLLASVGIVLVRIEHDNCIGQRIRGISIRQALIITKNSININFFSNEVLFFFFVTFWFVGPHSVAVAIKNPISGFSCQTHTEFAMIFPESRII
jgi:hypothetical protein